MLNGEIVYKEDIDKMSMVKTWVHSLIFEEWSGKKMKPANERDGTIQGTRGKVCVCGGGGGGRNHWQSLQL